MLPDIYQIISLVSPLLTGFVSYFVVQNNKRNSDSEADIAYLQKDLAEHKLQNSREYARKEDMVREYEAIMKLLQRIEDKLDHKADR